MRLWLLCAACADKAAAKAEKGELLPEMETVNSLLCDE